MARTRFSRLPASSDDLELRPSPRFANKPLPQTDDISGPKTVHLTLISRLYDFAIDLLLFSGCIGFLIFAGLAKSHDNAKSYRTVNFMTHYCKRRDKYVHPSFDLV